MDAPIDCGGAVEPASTGRASSCRDCQGRGSISVATHHPSCQGDCGSACPVELQVECDCLCEAGPTADVELELQIATAGSLA